MKKSAGANKRTLKRFLIRPTRQFKLIMAMLSIGILATALLMGYLVVKVANVVTVLQGSVPEAALFVDTSISPVLDLIIACNVFLWISSFVVGILISHRIYGPIVPLVRHIKNLTSGDYSSRVHLRDEDDFEEVATALNELAEQLSSKAPEAKP